MNSAMTMSSWIIEPPRRRVRVRPALSGLGVLPMPINAAKAARQAAAAKAARQAAKAATVVSTGGKSVTIATVASNPMAIAKLIPTSPAGVLKLAPTSPSAVLKLVPTSPTGVLKLVPTSPSSVLKTFSDPGDVISSIFGGGSKPRTPLDHAVRSANPVPFWWREAAYLRNNPDVADNVAQRFTSNLNDWFPSGWDHYDTRGGRPLTWLPNGTPPPAHVNAGNYAAWLARKQAPAVVVTPIRAATVVSTGNKAVAVVTRSTVAARPIPTAAVVSTGNSAVAVVSRPAAAATQIINGQPQQVVSQAVSYAPAAAPGVVQRVTATRVQPAPTPAAAIGPWAALAAALMFI